MDHFLRLSLFLKALLLSQYVVSLADRVLSPKVSPYFINPPNFFFPFFYLWGEEGGGGGGEGFGKKFHQIMNKQKKSVTTGGQRLT